MYQVNKTFKSKKLVLILILNLNLKTEVFFFVQKNIEIFNQMTIKQVKNSSQSRFRARLHAIDS